MSTLKNPLRTEHPTAENLMPHSFILNCQRGYASSSLQEKPRSSSPVALSVVAQLSARLVPLGRTVATPAVIDAVPYKELADALGRHMQRDWGNVCEADWSANDRALKRRERLLSSYSARESRPSTTLNGAGISTPQGCAAG